jgi:superfamily II DNA helicase RecQ
MRIRRALDAVDDESASPMAFELSNESQNLLTQPPEFLLPPNIFLDRQGTNNYVMEDDERDVINDALQTNLNIPQPHPFQTSAVHHGTFRDDSVLSISAKTGYGKSAIPAGIGSLRRGVVLTLVPLLGLGSDLVNKSVNLERGMEAYHIDEHKGDDAIMLADRLSSFTSEEAEHITIQLFVSPRSLTPDSPWAPVFRRLANRGLISVFCIDEAHSINRQRHFRPEFVDAALFMKTLYESQPEKRPFVAMSATFRREDQQSLFDLLKLEPTFVAWTDMNRRRIFFDVQVSGNPLLSIKSSLEFDFRTNPDIKAIVYTNSKRKAEESISPMAIKVLESSGVDGEVMALTGDSGLMEKMFIMEAFSLPVDADPRPDVPNVKIMPATAAANCGVSCRDCHRGYRLGPPPNMHDHVQEFGRVDRNQNRPAGFNRYEVHSDFHQLISQYVRAMQQPTRALRDAAIDEFYIVNSFLFTPEACYHVLMERFFEDDSVERIEEPCVEYCSFCTNGEGNNDITGLFRRQQLANVLLTKFLSVHTFTPDKFIKFLKDTRAEYFAEGHVPDKRAGPIHGLAIQLLCKKCIVPYVDEKYLSLIGTENLKSSHILLKAGTNEAGAILNQDVWNNMNCI